MNVFEDLIVELKEENLLENTIIDALGVNVNFGEPELGNEASFLRKQVESNLLRPEAVVERPREIPVDIPNRPVAETIRTGGIESGPPSQHKRYAEQAAAYQMVNQIFTAVERQAAGSIHGGYEDLKVSKALHRLSQASADPASGEFAEAELAAVNDIDFWVKSLTKRDCAITIPQLRLYCDTCVPALSSQALFSLARFYYELPTTDSVRAKFDFVVTKLFSKPADGDQRQLICPRSEIVDHLSSRFGTWQRRTSVNWKNVEDSLNSISFADFMAEAERASSLDELNRSDFFTRVRIFKDGVGENFFTPSVAASTIECNLAVGNKLLSLLQTEGKKIGVEQLRDKYTFLQRDSFESAANRTFDLEEVLQTAARKREAKKKEPVRSQKAIDRDLVDFKVEPPPRPELTTTDDSWASKSSFAINKWLLIVGTLAILVSVGLYFWADRIANDIPSSSDVKIVDMQDLPFKDFVKDGRISSETFYGITTPGWELLNKDEKQKLLAKMVRFGEGSHYKRVSLINDQGKTVGLAVGDRVEVSQP